MFLFFFFGGGVGNLWDIFLEMFEIVKFMEVLERYFHGWNHWFHVVSCNHHAVGHWSTHSWKPKPKKEVNSETAEVKQPFGRNFAGLCSKNNTHTKMIKNACLRWINKTHIGTSLKNLELLSPPPRKRYSWYFTGWWFQPIWKIVVKMGTFPK